MNKNQIFGIAQEEEQLNRLKEALRQYEEKEAEEQEQSEEWVVPSQEFRDAMENLINHPASILAEQRALQRKQKFKNAVRRTASAAAILIVSLTLAGLMAGTERISAFIPGFLVKNHNDFDTTEVILNDGSAAVEHEKEEECQLPGLEIGYLPEGFELEEEEENPDKIVQRYIFEQKEIAIQLAVNDVQGSLSAAFGGEKTELIYIGEMEVVKIVALGGTDVYIYVWQNGDYVIQLYVHSVEDLETEKIITSIQLLKE